MIHVEDKGPIVVDKAVLALGNFHLASAHREPVGP
jgi:hypothetical protein